MSERQGIEIDYAPKCRGVWLDRGELDKIIANSAGSGTSGPGRRTATIVTGNTTITMISAAAVMEKRGRGWGTFSMEAAPGNFRRLQ